MIELSLALVFIASVAGYLVNKYLNQRNVELDRKHQLNTKSADAEISAAIEKGLESHNDRINNTWTTISDVKQELNNLRMQIGLKVK